MRPTPPPRPMAALGARARRLRGTPARRFAAGLTAATVALLAAGTLSAADGAAFSGHVTAGYRDVQVDGDAYKYRQQVNLDDGARILDLGVVMRPAADDASDTLPDSIEFGASGLGGDPYQNLRLDVRKYGAYRFRYAHSRSDYFYENLLVRPEDASIEGSTGGDFHTFDFRRERDRADLDIDLTARASLSLGFDRYEKRGDSTTTQDEQREEFELDRPVDETSERYRVGLRYVWDRVTLTLDEQWQDYDNGSSRFLPGFSTGSDPDGPSTLDFFFLDQPYRFTTHDHHAGLRLRPDARWDISLDARLSDLDLDMEASERAQGTDFRGAPFTTDADGAADIDRDTAFYDLAVAWTANERVRLTAGARHHRLDQDGTLQFDGQAGASRWEIDTTELELGAELSLANALTAAATVSSERRETRFLQAAPGVADAASIDTERTGGSALLAWRPDRRLDVTLSAEIDRIDDPFTLASATDSRRYRLRGRYRWDNGLMVTASHRRTDRENDASGWNSDTKQTELRIAWQSDHLTASAGVSRVDLQRDIDQLVVGGFRSDLFAISYGAEADFVDGALSWRLNDRVDLSASYRTYDNEGSFGVERDDARAGLNMLLRDGYRVLVSYRNLDYEEDRLEAFDADLWEVALRLDW
ncbi:MAG TPA: hypothetical protein VLA56_06045 [Pseudomonadales bacterium]|nr:hypothetical protein [Pseudomonadales bacterium]